MLNREKVVIVPLFLYDAKNTLSTLHNLTFVKENRALFSRFWASLWGFDKNVNIMMSSVKMLRLTRNVKVDLWIYLHCLHFIWSLSIN